MSRRAMWPIRMRIFSPSSNALLRTTLGIYQSSLDTNLIALWDWLRVPPSGRLLKQPKKNESGERRRIRRFRKTDDCRLCENHQRTILLVVPTGKLSTRRSCRFRRFGNHRSEYLNISLTDKAPAQPPLRVDNDGRRQLSTIVLSTDNIPRIEQNRIVYLARLNYPFDL